MPALALAILGFWLLGSPGDFDSAAMTAGIAAAFHPSLLHFLPLVLVLALALLRWPPFVTIFLGALAGGLLAVVSAPERVAAFAGPELPSGLALLSELPGWIEDVRLRGASAVSLLGVRATAPWLLPGVKSTSYAVNMAADAEAKRRGADEAIFVDGEGIVLEGSVTNVWWRVGKTLRTPALDLGILAGVTRQTLLELAGPCGYTVEEGAFPLAEVLEADEVFTSSSVREILPVAELDGRRFDLGAAAAVLQQALRERAAKV